MNVIKKIIVLAIMAMSVAGMDNLNSDMKDKRTLMLTNISINEKDNKLNEKLDMDNDNINYSYNKNEDDYSLENDADISAIEIDEANDDISIDENDDVNIIFKLLEAWYDNHFTEEKHMTELKKKFDGVDAILEKKIAERDHQPRLLNLIASENTQNSPCCHLVHHTDYNKKLEQAEREMYAKSRKNEPKCNIV